MTGVQTCALPISAFEFDGKKDGIWVGKYESSGSAKNVKILPDVNALHLMTAGEMFEACQGIKISYGLTGDSHLIKNTEWGVVQYLAESKYGRNGTKVLSNNKDYITGDGNYKENASQSTTGNIYGIYDMSGTTLEYVAGYLETDNINENDNITAMLNAVLVNKKYADIYKDTVGNASLSYGSFKKMKGDAVYELTMPNSVSVKSWDGSRRRPSDDYYASDNSWWW